MVHTGRVPLFRRTPARAEAGSEPALEPRGAGLAVPVDPDPHLPVLDRYRADVLRRLVETVLEESTEGSGVGLVGPESFLDGSGRRHDLHDLAEACAPLELTAWKGLITEHLGAVAAPVRLDQLSGEEFRARLRVRLTAREHLAASVAELAQDLLPGVAQELVLHAPGQLHTVTTDDLATHGTYDELLTVALAHTRELVEHVQGVTLPQEGPDRITVVVGPEHFTATLATALPRVLDRASDEADWGHGVFVAIPTRAKLLYRVVDAPDAIGSLVRLFQQAQQAFDTEPGPVSPHVWWVRGEEWRQATGHDASGAPDILLREELETELARAGWV